MKPLAFNLKEAKKVAGDKNTSKFRLKNGHEITVFHKALPAEQRKALEKLPIHMVDGGDVPPYLAPNTPDAQESNVPEALSPNMPQQEDYGSNIGTAPEYPEAAQDLPNAGAPVSQQGQPPPQQAQSPSGQGLPDVSLGSIYGNEMGAIQQEKKANTQIAADTLQADKDYREYLEKSQKDFTKNLNAKNSEIDTVVKEIKDGKINPNAYREGMDTNQRVSTAIGLFLGGLGSAYTHQGNPAMDFLNRQIDRDIDAQKANMQNKKTLLGAYYDQTHNMFAAENMARATLLGSHLMQIREAADKQGTPLAIAKAQKATADAQSKIIPLIRAAQWAETQEKLNNAVGPQDAKIQSAMLQAKFNGDEKSYKDIQDKYVPGVGLAKVPVTSDDRQQIVSLQNLDRNLNHAIDLQNEFGKSGAWSVKNRADAANAKQELVVSLNQLYGLKRLNENEFKNYSEQVGNIGGVNMGGTLEGLKNMQSELKTRAQVLHQNLFGPGPQGAVGNQNQPQYKVGDVVYIKGQKAQITDANGNYRPIK